MSSWMMDEYMEGFCIMEIGVILEDLHRQLLCCILACLPLHALSGYLDCACLLQQIWQLALLCLELGVAANVLVVDEDVWNGALVGDLLEGILDSGAVIWWLVSVLIFTVMMPGVSRTYRLGRAR